MPPTKKKFVKWSGQRLEIVAWWTPEKGQYVTGILMQRNARPGGKINQPFYVLELTEESEVTPVNEDKPKMMAAGTRVAVPESYNLADLDQLIGYEVQLTCSEFRTFERDGEERTIRSFEVEHSEEAVRKDLQKTFGKKPEATPTAS